METNLEIINDAKLPDGGTVFIIFILYELPIQFLLGAVTQICWSNGWGVIAVSSSLSHLYFYSQYLSRLNYENSIEIKVHTAIYMYVLYYYCVLCSGFS